MTIEYCCYGMYCDMGHDATCPTGKLCKTAKDQWQKAYYEFLNPFNVLAADDATDICFFNHPLLPGRYIINTSFLRV